MATTANGHIGLADVIGKIEATILIGLSTVGGAFSETLFAKWRARFGDRSSFLFPIRPRIRSESRGSDSMDRWLALSLRRVRLLRLSAMAGAGFPSPSAITSHLPGHRTRCGRLRRPASDGSA